MRTDFMARGPRTRCVTPRTPSDGFSRVVLDLPEGASPSRGIPSDSASVGVGVGVGVGAIDGPPTQEQAGTFRGRDGAFVRGWARVGSCGLMNGRTVGRSDGRTQPVGPASRTASEILNLASFSRKLPASFRAIASYASLSAHVFRGSSTSLGTPSTATGMCRPKMG